MVKVIVFVREPLSVLSFKKNLFVSTMSLFVESFLIDCLVYALEAMCGCIIMCRSNEWCFGLF